MICFRGGRNRERKCFAEFATQFMILNLQRRVFAPVGTTAAKSREIANLSG
jgi:hypothetical protein